jgi:GDP-D-mannose dehydratase
LSPVYDGEPVFLLRFYDKVFLIKKTNLLTDELRSHVNKSFFRPLNINISRANPSKAKKKLNWEPKRTLDDIIKK